MRVARLTNQPRSEELPRDVRDVETIYRDVPVL